MLADLVTGRAADGAGTRVQPHESHGAGRGRRRHSCGHTVAAAAGAIKRRNRPTPGPFAAVAPRLLYSRARIPLPSSAIWPVEWGGTPPSSWGSCWSRSSRPGRSCATSTTRSPRRRPATPASTSGTLGLPARAATGPAALLHVVDPLGHAGRRARQSQPPQLHDVRQRPGLAADAAGRPRRRVQPDLPLQHRALRLCRSTCWRANDVGREAESLIAGAAFALSPVLIARGVGHFSLVAAAPLPIFGLLLRTARRHRSGAVRVRASAPSWPGPPVRTPTTASSAC